MGPRGQFTQDFNSTNATLHVEIKGGDALLWLVMAFAMLTVCCVAFIAARKQELRSEPTQVLSPEQVLSCLEPFLTHLHASTSGSISEIMCSICLGNFEINDVLVALPCKHHFHKACISDWIVHKGVGAPCPLCKRLIAPKLLDVQTRSEPGVELLEEPPVIIGSSGEELEATATRGVAAQLSAPAMELEPMERNAACALAPHSSAHPDPRSSCISIGAHGHA
tara:strand:- start:11 stop:679 length:669 start_codon:yes stop_codon:yes gene_type:complete